MIQFHRTEILRYDYEVFENKSKTPYCIAKDDGWFYVYEDGHILDRFGSLRNVKEFIVSRLENKKH